MNVLIADEHVLVREGIKRFLQFEQDINIIDEVANGEDAVKAVKAKRPDILLLKMHIKKLNVYSVVRRVHLFTKVIVLSSGEEDNGHIAELSTLGVRGCLYPDMTQPEFVNALRLVQKGGSYFPFSLLDIALSKKNFKSVTPKKMLTMREIEIVQLIGKGMNNIEIADALFLSEKTIKNHLTKIFKKIDVSDRTQALLYALKNKVIDLD